MKMNSQQSKTYGHSKNSSEKKVLSDAGLPKKDRKILNKKLNPTSTRTGQTTTDKAQSK